MSALLDTVRELAFPRLTGTAGESRAADAMARFFAESGLEVEREEISVCRAAMFRYRALLHGLAAVVALSMGLTAAAAPIVALLLGAALLFVIARAGSWPLAIEAGFDRPPLVSSENVVARRRGPRGGVVLVFLAHFDSKSARFPTFFPVVLVVLGAIVVVTLTGVSALSLVRGVAIGGPWWPLSVLGALAFLPPLWNRTGNESPGAMDNASGCAVLRELAATLPGEGALRDVELVFLATGAEEIGLAGAMRWIQRHESELSREKTVFVNVDSVGVGRGLLALDVRGRVPDGRSVRETVRAAGCSSGIPVRAVSFLPGVGVDTMPIAARGFPTVTILGKVLGAASRRIHSRRDTIEHLTEDGLRDAVGLARAFALEIARRR